MLSLRQPGPLSKMSQESCSKRRQSNHTAEEWGKMRLKSDPWICTGEITGKGLPWRAGGKPGDRGHMDPTDAESSSANYWPWEK